ncbi:hypothetical protein GIB67_031193 [Kingdonia uniflora]|uniref:Leucine-rich repeat-containing N-terminal plant-type domain-containing protein n=1 Tax=Kingdonia uniflora TaxID=39325 RepID=A0A7J7NKR5_9MAGN|nr:hypothetical protein GIB67_031193 [Kingdonia uniflora]
MVSTHDQLKQTKKILVSSLKIHRKPNSKKNVNSEMGNSEDRFTELEHKVSNPTTILGELVVQLHIANLAKVSTLTKRQERKKKKGIAEEENSEGNKEEDKDSSDAESVKKISVIAPRQEREVLIGEKSVGCSTVQRPGVIVLLLLTIMNFSSSSSLGDRSKVTCIEREREALLSFRKGLIDRSNRLESWESDDCCKWIGVQCDNATGHIVHLNLRNPVDLYDDGSYEKHKDLKLRGELNLSLLELKGLNYLDLSQNEFRGIPVPSFLGSLHNLKYLNLSIAGFVGGRSLRWASNLSSLQYLDMSQVDLRSSSDWLQVLNTLPSLLELNLSNCGLGKFHFLPNVNFTALVSLDLSFNSYSLMPNWLFNLTRLVSLDLRYNNFHGPLPNALLNLNALELLDLSHNLFLNSTIPHWLYNFTSLVGLDLSYNDLSGTISSDVGNLTSLTNLHISNNKFEGGLPNTLANLCSLQELDLSTNKLTGEISPLLGNSSRCISNSLRSLLLGSNRLLGSIPMSLGKFSLFEVLDLQNNKLNGSVPKELGFLSKLNYLSVSNNSLDGVVSEGHFVNLTRLTTLGMSSNPLVFNVSTSWVPPFQLKHISLNCQMGPKFPEWLKTQRDFGWLELSGSGISDTIPNWFWNLSSKISHLDLSHNQIKGELPNHSILNSEDLRVNQILICLGSNHFEGPIPHLSSRVHELDLSNNSFSGPISTFLCNPRSKENQLIALDLSGNLISGELPQCWMYWPYLEGINLGNNNLTGTIPSSIGSLLTLTSLNLRSNSLYGELPSSMRNCSGLTTIDIGENKFTGNIPIWMGKSFPNLLILVLHSNKFDGTIPQELCHLTSLRILYLSHNHLLGTIPSCFNNFSAMATAQNPNRTYIDFSYNLKLIEKTLLVTKGMEQEYSITLALVTSMDLSANNLSGTIPTEMTSLVGLRWLNLSGNSLTGMIPKNVGSMTSMESLDLSNNHLSGEIPQSMSKITFLGYLNFSYNNLSGKIPTSTQLQSFNESSYIGNPELCGPPLENKCTEDKSPPGQDEGNKIDENGEESWIDWFSVSMAPGFIVGFCGFYVILVFKKSWRIALFRFIEDVRAGLEMAVIDAIVKGIGVPLWRLFGGVSNTITTDIMIPIVSPAEAANLALKYYKEGFNTLKLKVGHNLDSDRKMGVTPILFEQPVHRDDWEGLGRVTHVVKSKYGISVTADECCRSLVDVEKIIKENLADVINIKLAKVGVLGALEIIEVVRESGLNPMIGGMVATSWLWALLVIWLLALGISTFANPVSYQNSAVLISSYDTRGVWWHRRYRRKRGLFPEEMGLFVKLRKLL